MTLVHYLSGAAIAYWMAFAIPLRPDSAMIAATVLTVAAAVAYLAARWGAR